MVEKQKKKFPLALKDVETDRNQTDPNHLLDHLSRCVKGAILRDGVVRDLHKGQRKIEV